MTHYVYNGPVIRYGKILADNYKCDTWADSDAKARANIAYKFKQWANLTSNSGGISFPAKLKIVKE